MPLLEKDGLYFRRAFLSHFYPFFNLFQWPYKRILKSRRLLCGSEIMLKDFTLPTLRSFHESKLATLPASNLQEAVVGWTGQQEDVSL